MSGSATRKLSGIEVKNQMKENEELLSREEAQLIKHPMNITEKRVSEKLDDMLNALNDDLYAYYYWEDEETSNSVKLSIFTIDY